MKMKALSLKQPWATMVASGAKTIETRTWSTNYRGELLIVASKTVDEDAMEFFCDEIMRNRTDTDAAKKLLESAFRFRGVALAVVRLVDCRKMTKGDEKKALRKTAPNLWAWVLDDIRPVAPFKVVEVETLDMME